MHLLRAAHSGRQDRGPPPGICGGRRRYSDRVPAIVSYQGHRLRQFERPAKQGRPTGSEHACLQGPRRVERTAGDQLSCHRSQSAREGNAMTDQHPIADPPLIEGNKTLAQVTADVCAPLERRAGPLWWAAFLVSFGFLLLGIAAVTYQSIVGIGTWGLNRSVGWAFDITNFVFWIGIGHAGTLISAILFLFRQ